MQKLADLVAGKKVLYITTHRVDYIRVEQECALIREHAASLDVVYQKVDQHIISAFLIFWRLLFRNMKKYDVVMVTYMSQLVVPVLQWKMKRNILIVDFFVSLYDSLVFDRQKVREGTALAKWLWKLDDQTLRAADHLIADTYAHADYFSEEFGIEKDGFEVIYLKADEKIYYPREEKKDEAFASKFVVLYFGTVIPLQGFEIVLEAARRLSDQDQIHFVIIGPLDEKDRQGIRNATFPGWISQEELARYIAMSDLCLAGHFNDEIMKAKRTIPGKAYIYEAMNKPMILGDNAANHERYEEGGNIHYVKMGDAAALAGLISKICDDCQERKDDGNKHQQG